MKKIDWDKLCYSVMLGLLLSTGIVLLSILIVLCIKLICTSFELAALIITFILLVVGLAYWIYKEES
jgi:hypothetical protein